MLPESKQALRASSLGSSIPTHIQTLGLLKSRVIKSALRAGHYQTNPRPSASMNQSRASRGLV